MNDIGSENPDFANSLEVRPVSLGEVYQRERSDTSGAEIVYVPDSEQVESAEAILGSDFTGVPIFISRNVRGWITAISDDRIAAPSFFDIEDLQGFLDMYKQQEPDLAASVFIEVTSLEDYVASFETGDNLVFNLFTLVPSSETIELISG